MVVSLFPWKPGSKSAKALATALGIKRIKHKNSKFRGHRGKTVINWGSSYLPDEVRWCNVINDVDTVSLMSDKLQGFKRLNGHCQLPPYTTDPHVAWLWLEEGYHVCARRVLCGHSAKGLVYLTACEDLVPAPLYTKYIKKKDEYRVHVFGEKILDIQQKKRIIEVRDEDVNWQVRNLANGFTYARENVVAPECVIEEGLKAMAASGLHFGAVDIIYNEHDKKAYVLEINTAPGLMGTTLEKYVEVFKDEMLHM